MPVVLDPLPPSRGSSRGLPAFKDDVLQPLSASLSKKKVKSYQILGDVTEFQTKLAATIPPKKEPEPDNIDTVDPADFPDEIWFAASISPDKGVAIIKAYREICRARDAYQAQLQNIHTFRQQQDLNLTSRSFAGQTTITEAVHETSQPRRMEKFAAQQKQWDSMAQQLAHRTQRPPAELAMTRGPEWRSKEEILQLLEAARPIQDRSGSADVWAMSLRDAWERIIPLGNIFSGLSLTVKEKPSKASTERLEHIGRPNDSLTMPDAMALLTPTGKGSLGKSLTVRGRAWQDSQTLKARQQQYAGRIKALIPHEPELQSLSLQGESLESQLQELAQAPITLQEVEAHMAAHEPEKHSTYMLAKAEIEAEIQAQYDAALAAAQAREAAEAAARPQPGVHLQLSSDRLVMECQVQESASCSFTLTHTGTTAAYYAWHRKQPPQLPHATSNQSIPRFYLANQAGTILPGQTITFRLEFKTQQPGIFTEQWVLRTQPQMPQQDIHMTLRGVAVQQDTTQVQVAELSGRLDQKEKIRKVEAALNRILQDVHPVVKKQAKDSKEAVAANLAWDASHGELWPPVYYSSELAEQLQQLYTIAWNSLRGAEAPPPTPPEEGKKKGKASKKEEPPPPPPPPKFPETWPGDMQTLHDVITDLTVLRPEQGEQFAKQAEQIKEQCRVPQDTRRFTRHAIRSVLVKVLDAVGEKLDKVKADYESRLAEQQQEAAQAEAAGLAASASQGDIDAQWFTDKARTATRTLFKNHFGKLGEVVLQEKEAVGDFLEGKISHIDDRTADAMAAGGSAPELEQLYWQRYTLLREWTRLGVPSRETVH